MFDHFRLVDPVFGSGKGAFDKGLWKLMHFLESLTGFWPFHRGRKIIALRIYFYFSILVIIIPMVIRLFEEIGHHMAIVVENLVGTMILLTSLCKFSMAHYFLHQRKLLYKQITDNYASQIDNEEYKIVSGYEYHGYKVTSVYIVVLSFGVTSFMAMPLLLPTFTMLLFPNSKSNDSSSRKTLPYEAEYFIDQEAYFYPLIIKDIISGCVGLVAFFTYDLGYVLSVYHVCGLFAVVISVNLIEQCYNSCWFIVLLLNMLILGSGLVVVSMKLDNIAELIRYGVIFSSTFLHFYIIFSPGQEVINKSLEVFDSCYNCEWYKLSRISVTLLQVIMLRSIKSCSLTGGKMFTLCMETYASMMKTGLSYFTVFAV